MSVTKSDNFLSLMLNQSKYLSTIDISLRFFGNADASVCPEYNVWYSLQAQQLYFCQATAIANSVNSQSYQSLPPTFINLATGVHIYI